MAYSAEVMQRAQARLAQARYEHESEGLRRLSQAYRQVPRLREIDLELRRSMSGAIRAAFISGEDGRQALEQVKQNNQALQRERQALVAANFEPGYLDDAPLCAKCGGSGYVGSTMCGCLAELCRQEQRQELTFLSAGQESFEKFRLDYYPDRIDPRTGVNVRAVMEKTFQICRSYAANFAPGAGNLLFSGGTGLGKTFLSACIARTVADRGCSVVYESAAHLFSKLERAKFSGDEDARREAEKFTACDLLIVDDLGTEMGGQFTTSALYILINDRLMDGKSTIISTNLTNDDLERRYSAAIASRLRGSFRRIAFMGEDIRLKKGWNG